MSTVGDIYQVVDESVMLGQKCINVYFYQVTFDPPAEPGALDLAQAFVDQVLPAVADIQSSDVLHQSVRATNLFNPSDAAEILLSLPGASGTDSSSTFMAYPFRLVGDNAAVRSGSKRIAGVENGSLTDGVIDNSGLIALCNTAADAMNAVLTFGIVPANVWAPVIVKRLLVGGDYVLPTSLGEAVVSVVLDVLFDALVTSQVSRKVGIGE